MSEEDDLYMTDEVISIYCVVSQCGPVKIRSNIVHIRILYTGIQRWSFHVLMDQKHRFNLGGLSDLLIYLENIFRVHANSHKQRQNKNQLITYFILRLDPENS